MLCLCVGSVYWKEDRAKRKHYEGLLGEKRAQEKRDAWIRELEARDEEDKLEREKKRKRREVRQQMEKRREIEKSEGGEVEAQNSMLDERELRGLAVSGSPLLAAAMGLWRRRSLRHEDGED